MRLHGTSTRLLSTRLLRLWGAAVGGSLLLAACAGPAAPVGPTPAAKAAEPAAATKAPAPARVPVQIGLASKLAGHWPLWVGTQEGIFDKAGIDFSVLVVDTDSRLVQALLSNSLQLITGTVPQIQKANAAGGQMVGIAGLQNKPVYRMVGAKGMKSIKDLAGKKIGVSETEIGVDAYVARTWLAQIGIKEGSYTLVGTGGVATRVAALSGGAVDATVLPPPADLPVIQQGFSDLGLSMSAVQHMQWTMLTANKPWIAANADTANRFLRAYVEAATWLRDPANKDKAIKHLVAETNTNAQNAALFYQQLVAEGAISQDGGIDGEGFAVWSGFLGVPAAQLRDTVYDGQYLTKAKAR